MDNPNAKRKVQVEALAPVDHTLTDYADFNKNFYTPHPDIAAMTDEQVDAYRKSLGTNLYQYLCQCRYR